MPCRNLTKQTAHIDVPKELSNVDSKKENRKRKRSLSIEFLFILLLQCLITLFFHFKRYQFFQRRIKEHEVDISEKVTYFVKEVKAPVYNLQIKTKLV